jgi:hypothetical protein
MPNVTAPASEPATFYPSRWDANRLICTAFHEAGHATILLACGRTVDLVTIEPSNGSNTLGYMLPATAAVTSADRHALLRSIIAGPYCTGVLQRAEIPEALVDLARQRLTERAARTPVLDDAAAGAHGDEPCDGTLIDRLLVQLWPDSDASTQERHYECAVVETAALVSRNWVAVNEAVYLLLQHGAVDGAMLAARVTPLLVRQPAAEHVA